MEIWMALFTYEEGVKLEVLSVEVFSDVNKSRKFRKCYFPVTKITTNREDMCRIITIVLMILHISKRLQTI